MDINQIFVHANCCRICTCVHELRRIARKCENRLLLSPAFRTAHKHDPVISCWQPLSLCFGRPAQSNKFVLLKKQICAFVPKRFSKMNWSFDLTCRICLGKNLKIHPENSKSNPAESSPKSKIFFLSKITQAKMDTPGMLQTQAAKITPVSMSVCC